MTRARRFCAFWSLEMIFLSGSKQNRVIVVEARANQSTRNHLLASLKAATVRIFRTESGSSFQDVEAATGKRMPPEVGNGRVDDDAAPSCRTQPGLCWVSAGNVVWTGFGCRTCPTCLSLCLTAAKRAAGSRDYHRRHTDTVCSPTELILCQSFESRAHTRDISEEKSQISPLLMPNGRHIQLILIVYLLTVRRSFVKPIFQAITIALYYDQFDEDRTTVDVDHRALV